LNENASRPGKVAYQGIDGAYSHLAAKKFFSALGEAVEFVGFKSFADVVEAVEDGSADYAVLPVENTTAGNINDVYDLLLRTKLSIVGEEIFPVRHCLLAVDDVPVSRIRRVLSHPQALAQCSRYLSQMKNCQADYYADTAMAVLKVKEDGDPTQAAIASEEAGRLYGLKVLARDLADQPQNFTRFVVVHRRPIKVDPRIPSKTSMVIATAHHPGALNKALDVLSQFEINMTKLDSRPKPGSPFDYLFYIDFEGHIEEERVERALTGLRAVTSYLKILGSYPREQRGRTQPRVQSLVAQQPESSATVTAVTPSSPPATTDRAGTRTLLTRRSSKDTDTTIRIGHVEIGGGELVVLAGPMSIESETQLRQVARSVKENGAKLLRANAFRSDGGGLAATPPAERLRLVARIGREYDLPVVTDVQTPEEVTLAAESVDILVVTARNMQNIALLGAVGKVSRPVILERNPLATLEEFLDAAEFIVEQGNHQVILCERGIRTFETVTRHTLDLGAIPILERLTHLPVLVDPCYAADRHDLVLPLALAAKAVGADGLVLPVDLEARPGEANGPRESSLVLGPGELQTVLAKVYNGR
ncbi:MAG TPA: prephenate dehydratase, partial [Planctomycetota bacterium]|nr:prephenate dehydratase [Planctomycetota bacterium]